MQIAFNEMLAFVQSSQFFSLWIFVSGFVTSLLVLPFLKYFLGKRSPAKKIYAFHHGTLNVELPPATMWMNMGCWETKDTNFPDACLALLRKVLIEAGLGAEEDIKKSKIIDLGIGCGEQSLILARECYQYIGITIDKDQLNFALSRREWENLEAEYPSSSATKSTKDDRKAQLYLADAAKPVCWSRQLRDATSTKNGQENEENACWVLALDCLYHFSPSRKPVLHFANHNANASIMAFDLILSPSSTVLQRFLLRILTLIMGVPSSNFITKTQYEDQLIKAGYSKDRISISDISDGVFSGLAGFIEKRDEDWRTFTGQGIGPYRMFARILRWWEKSGVVRGVIVVAKR